MSCLFQELLDKLNAMFMPLELENNSVLTVLEENWLLNRHPSAKIDSFTKMLKRYSHLGDTQKTSEHGLGYPSLGGPA